MSCCRHLASGRWSLVSWPNSQLVPLSRIKPGNNKPVHVINFKIVFKRLDQSMQNLLWLQNGCCAVECTPFFLPRYMYWIAFVISCYELSVRGNWFWEEHRLLILFRRVCKSVNNRYSFLRVCFSRQVALCCTFFLWSQHQILFTVYRKD